MWTTFSRLPRHRLGLFGVSHAHLSDPKYNGNIVAAWLSMMDTSQEEGFRSNARTAIRVLGINPLKMLGIRLQAIEGYTALGSAAKPAIPEITKLLGNAEIAFEATWAVDAIGKDMLPCLAVALLKKKFYPAAFNMANPLTSKSKSLLLSVKSRYG